MHTVLAILFVWFIVVPLALWLVCTIGEGIYNVVTAVDRLFTFTKPKPRATYNTPQESLERLQEEHEEALREAEIDAGQWN